VRYRALQKTDRVKKRVAFSAAHTQDTAILPLRLVGVRVRGGGAFTLPSASESGPMSMLPCMWAFQRSSFVG